MMVALCRVIFQCSLLCFLLSIAFTLHAQNVWKPFTRPHLEEGMTITHVGDNTLYAMSIRDSNFGNQQGNFGYTLVTIYRSNDRGANWVMVYHSIVTRPTDLYISSGLVFDDSTYAGGGSGFIQGIKGQNKVGYGDNSQVYALFPLKDTSDFLATYSVYHYTDATTQLFRVSKDGNWVSLYKPDTLLPPVNKLIPMFSTIDTGFLEIDTNSRFYSLLYTSNAGKTWENRNLALPDTGYVMYSTRIEHGSGLNWLALCHSYKKTPYQDRTLLERANDGGKTWTIDSTSLPYINDLVLSQNGKFYATVRNSHSLARSENGGISWTAVDFNFPQQQQLLYVGDSIAYTDNYWSNVLNASTGAGITIDQSDINFDSIQFGATSCRTVAIHSTGNRPLHLAFDPTNDSSVVLSPLGAITIQPGDSAVETICIQGNTSREQSKLIHLVSDANDFDTSISLYWRVLAAAISVDTSVIDLGDVILGQIVRVQLRLYNFGWEPLHIDSVLYLSPELSRFSSSPSIFPHRDYIARFQLLPTSLGNRFASLILFSNDPSVKSNKVRLRYHVVDSTQHKVWSIVVHRSSDSISQAPQSLAADTEGGVVFCGLSSGSGAFAASLDAAGNESWRIAAGRSARVIVTRQGRVALMQLLDDSLQVRELSRDGTKTYWKTIDSGYAEEPIFFGESKSGNLEISTAGFSYFPTYYHGPEDLGSILIGTLTPAGKKGDFYHQNGSAIFAGNGAQDSYGGYDYPSDLAFDSSGNRHDLLFLSDSVDYWWQAYPKFYYDVKLGGFLKRYVKGLTAKLQVDTKGNSLLLLNELLKLRPNGAVVWSAPVGGSLLAVNSYGETYVTGPDFVISKIDSNGNKIWQRQYLGWEDEPGYVSAITVDRSGKAYVTGSSGYPDSVHTITMRFTRDGECDWIARYDSPYHTKDVGNMIAVDGQGNVFVLGSTTNNVGAQSLVVLKYSPPQDSFANSVGQPSTAEIPELQIFPNPARDRVTIAYHPKGKTLQRARELLVTDITGREVAKKSMDFGAESQCTISLGKLSEGLYFVRILGQGLSAKFIIRH